MIPGELLHAAFSPDGALLALSDADQRAGLWQVSTGSSVIELGEGDEATSWSAFSSDGAALLSGGGDGWSLWDLPGLRRDARGSFAVGWLDSVSFTAFAGGVTPVVCSTIRCGVWGPAGTAEVGEFSLGYIMDPGVPWFIPAFSPDGGLAVANRLDFTGRVVALPAGAELAALVGHRNYLTQAGFSPSGGQILTASLDLTIRLWDGGSFRPGPVLTGHDAAPSARFHPDGSSVLSAAADSTVRLWRIPGALGQELRGGTDEALASFSGDGRRLLVTDQPYGGEPWVEVWDAAARTLLRRVDLGDTPRVSASISSDGQLLAATSMDGVTLWNLDEGTRRSLEVGDVERLTLSPTGARLLTHPINGVRLWELASGEEHSGLVARGFVESLTLSPDESLLLLSAGWPPRILKTDTDELVATLVGPEAPIRRFVFSSDGQRVLGIGAQVQIWDAATGASGPTLSSHGQWVLDATFSLDGRRVLTAAEDGMARTWDADTGALLFEFGIGVPKQADFSQDGLVLLTHSDDETARIWDTTTGEQGPEVTDPGGTRRASLSPDGRQVLTVSHEGEIRLWPISREAVVEALWRSTAVCLRVEERVDLLGEPPELAADGLRSCRTTVKAYAAQGAYGWPLRWEE